MDSEMTLGGFQLSHLIVIFILMGCAAFIIYWLWSDPCGERPAQRSTVTSPSARSGRVLSHPETTSSSSISPRHGEMVLYATEIEPGTVVLQSPYGDLFRVLREYDSITQSGSPTSSLPPGTSLPVHYIPAYTRAHVQNHPSAPPYQEITEERPLVSTSTDTWRPLCLQSANDY